MTKCTKDPHRDGAQGRGQGEKTELSQVSDKA